FRTIGVEGVTNAELEAGEVRGLVHDHVVVTNGVSSCESSTDVSLVETTAEWIGYAWQVLGGDVSLTTEVQLTPAVTSQTQSGLTTEQTVTLLVGTGTQIETAFQNEHSTQAITQIFRTLQAPTVAGLDAIDHAGFLLADRLHTITVRSIRINTFELLVTDTTVQNTVQGDRRFCVCDASEAGHQSSSEQSLFHVRNLRRFE